jgi:menaquinone-specific isochorismate synthase
MSDRIKNLMKIALREYLNEVNLQSLKKNAISTIAVSIFNIDVLEWLSAQPHSNKFYWSDRDKKEEIGSVGILCKIKENPLLNERALFQKISEILGDSSTEVRFYGGMKFNLSQANSQEWQAFGSSYFFIPIFESVRSPDGVHLRYNFKLGDKEKNVDAIEKFEFAFSQLNFDLNKIDLKLPAVHKTVEIPSQKEWFKMIERALHLISNGELEKIVLARKSCFFFQTELDPVQLLGKLKKYGENSFIYFLQLDRIHSFLGATPEQIYNRKDQEIISEAIAGTRPRGAKLAEDQKLASSLLSDEKEIREHNWVCLDVEKGMNRLCKKIKKSRKNKVLKLAFVQHLHREYQGFLKPAVTDKEILETLHPTPAVAGYPREKSKKFIYELEGFDRGWYAGPIGWIGKMASQFAVAIRSALLKGRDLTLFAGAGIVAGSDSEKEWQEIENKILNFTKILS